MEKFEQFLSELDFACDVKAAYAELREEMPVSKAVAELKREFAEERQDEDDAPQFWLGLAAVMAESKELTNAVKEKALSYFTDEAFVERYGEMSAFTSDDIEELKAYFDSSTGKAKKAPKVKSPYRAETSWKVGEVYAYPLQSETAHEHGVAGRFLMFHVLETGGWVKDLVPVVHVYITRDEKLPKTGQELSKCIIIPPFSLNKPLKLRWIISCLRVKNFERNDNIFCLGEFSDVSVPEEFIPKDYIYYGILLWEEIEKPLKVAKRLELI